MWLCVCAHQLQQGAGSGSGSGFEGLGVSPHTTSLPVAKGGWSLEAGAAALKVAEECSACDGMVGAEMQLEI